jgi:hypothetical protein
MRSLTASRPVPRFLTRRADDLPAAYLDELQHSEPVQGVHVYTRDGKIVDVTRDPQTFDGPDGVPEGWYRGQEDRHLEAIGLIAIGALLLSAAVSFSLLWLAFRFVQSLF